MSGVDMSDPSPLAYQSLVNFPASNDSELSEPVHGDDQREVSLLPIF